MTTQIDVGGNKNFDDVYRNNVNRGDVNQRIAVIVQFIVAPINPNVAQA